MKTQSVFLLASLVTAGAGAARTAGDAAKGQMLYQARCAACHSIAYNGVGPAHKGVFGRKAGSAPGYTYSPALSAAGFVWDEALLERWLKNPEQLVPGQKMGISVASAHERADLIAYLKKETAGK
jgi:cytochrome c